MEETDRTLYQKRKKTLPQQYDTKLPYFFHHQSGQYWSLFSRDPVNDGWQNHGRRLECGFILDINSTIGRREPYHGDRPVRIETQ